MAKWNKGQPAPNVITDMVGKKFGRLTVIERYPVNTKDRKAQWVCKCDCGNIAIASGKSLRTGSKLSCGCLRSETTTKKNYKHGFALKRREARIYKIYQDMIRRCYDPRRKNYDRYGGRGIYVCDEWYDPNDFAKGFVVFKDWAYTNGYYDQPEDTPRSVLLSIDRIDNDGPYAPWNCRWVLFKYQSGNRNYNRLIFNGKEMLTTVRFCKKYNIPKSRFYAMLKQGWSIHQIINKAQHSELNLKLKDGMLRDRNGFIHLTPKVDQSEVRNPYG